MEIAYHIGAHCTDDERLVHSLLKNKDDFKQNGIYVPHPNKYRKIVRETIQALDGSTPTRAQGDAILNAILDGNTPERILMSNQNFICVPNRICEDGTFYAQTESKLKGLQSLFPDCTIEVFLSTRNLATFLPAAFTQSNHASFTQFMRGQNPRALLWSDMIARIRKTLPDSPITVWCNEDTPLIWAEIIRSMAAISQDHKILGGFDLLPNIVKPIGLNRLLQFVRQNPPRTPQQLRRIIGAFLDKYAIEDEIEDEITVPDMTDALIEELTNSYDDDIFKISQMDDIDFIDV